MGLCQRGSVCTSARQIGSWRNVLLFCGGWRGGGGGSEEESAPFSEFLSGQPAMVNMFNLEMLFVQREFVLDPAPAPLPKTACCLSPPLSH